MAYLPNIPANTDLISNSQSQIQGNFQKIDPGTTGSGIGFARNHVTMTDGTNGGLHNEIDFYQALASPTISGFVGALYPKTVTNIELFYKNGSKDMQVSNSLLTNTLGEGMMPGGLQIRSANLVMQAAGPVTFSRVFPNACIAVTCNSDTGTQTPIFVGNLSPSGFTFARQGAGLTTIYYIAVGY